MTKKMADPKDTIMRLLDVIGISRVIYVDDVFAASRETVTAKCDALRIDEVASAGAFPEIDFTVDDEDIAREQVRRAVDAMDASELLVAFARLAAAGGAGTPNLDAETVPKFVQLLDGFELLRLSGSEWAKSCDRLLAEGDPPRTLFVFDEDFRQEGLTANEGRRFLRELHGRLTGVTASYALLTHMATDEAAERSLQQAVLGEAPELKGRLIVVAKQRLSQEQDGFAWRLKLAVLAGLFMKLKMQFRQAVADATEAGSRKLDTLEVDAFERIVFHSSSVEGVWAPETLVRIFGTHFERQVVASIRSQELIHELAEKARQISQIETSEISDTTTVYARDLQRTTIYIETDGLNKLHLPTELGDIYEAEGSHFILIAQPCDLMVRERNNGYRKGETNGEWALATLARISPRKKKNPSSELEFDLPFFGDELEMRYVAKFNEIYPIPIWLLDLAALRSDGKCLMRAGDLPSPLLIPAWRSRHGVLLERAKAVIQRYCSISALRQENTPGVFEALLGLPTGICVNAGSAQPATELETDWGLIVGLRRVKRLREPYASALLTKHGHWLTRPAYPHDFTRMS